MKSISSIPAASTSPNGPATHAPQAGTASHNEGSARLAATNSEPGIFDVGFAFCVFSLFAAWSVGWCAVRAALFAVQARWLGVRRWLAIRRLCAWCKGHLGGNPFARSTSHGICPCCLAVKKAEAFSYSAAVSPRTITANTN